MTSHDESIEMPAAEFMSVEVEPARLRSIIDGLRKLPNVTDMPVIVAIAELDRIASTFEAAAKRRQEMFQAILDAMRGRVLSGEIAPTEGCDCVRCHAVRIILANEQQAKPATLNS